MFAALARALKSVFTKRRKPAPWLSSVESDLKADDDVMRLNGDR